VTANAAGARQFGIEAYRDTTRRENLLSQTDFIWQGSTGPLSHVLLAGFEYGDQDTRNERINGFFTGVPTTSSGRRTVIALADPIQVPNVEFRAGAAFAGNRAVGTEAEVLAFYLQDQISFGEHVDLIAGSGTTASSCAWKISSPAPPSAAPILSGRRASAWC
jgi:catecholate siderophore receptor